MPLNAIFRALIATLEQDVVPDLPPGYSRAQALAVAATLDQLVARVEERPDLVKQENAAIRGTLAAIVALLRSTGKQDAMRAEIEGALAQDNASPAEGNAGLKQALDRTIAGLAGLGLTPEEEAAAVRLIHAELRAQLEREKQLLRPIKHWAQLFAEG